MEVPKVLSGVVSGLHHVAIAVHEIAAVRAVWEEGLGLKATVPEFVPEQGVNVLVLHTGEQRIELVEPVGEDSPIRKFLAKRGPGMHHVAFRVADLEAALARLKERGVQLIDEEPQPGAHGTRVAFLHPRAVNGVLIELVEEPS